MWHEIGAQRGITEISVKGRCIEGLTKGMLKKAVRIWTGSAIVDVSEDVKQYEQDCLDGKVVWSALRRSGCDLQEARAVLSSWSSVKMDFCQTR